VIAAEDQKFPDHWGFDVTAIEKALAHNERNEKTNNDLGPKALQVHRSPFLQGL